MSTTKQRGQVLVIFALGALAFLGAVALAVDVGQSYITRRHLQNVADQAALAGATELPDGTAAVSVAETYAQHNGVSAGEVVAHVPPSTGHYSGEAAPYHHVEVIVQRQVNFLFAGLLGQGAATVSARATATDNGGPGAGAIISLDTDKDSMVFTGSADLLVEGDVWSNGELDADSSGGTRHVTGYAYIVGEDNAEPPHFVTDGGELVPEGPTPDPLAAVPTPSAPADPVTPPSNPYQKDGWDVYRPGTYTKLDIKKPSKFLPGIYVITGKDGVDIGDTVVGVPNDTVYVDEADPDSTRPSSASMATVAGWAS